MYKQLAAACFCVFFLGVPSIYAVIFNEIMYDPLGADDNYEWIEIFNDQNQTVNLQNWKFFEDNTNHNLVLVQGSFSLLPGSLAVIAEDAATFLQQNTNFSGTLIDSTFSLSNTGETLVLKNSSSHVQDNITYSYITGASENGYSLGLHNSIWKETLPTPGFANQVSNICDWSASIISNKLIFENKTDLSWQVKVERQLGEPTSVVISRSVEDINGNIVKSYDDLTHNITNVETLNYDPNLNPGTYLLKASINPSCNESNAANNMDERLVAIREAAKESSSHVSIENIYDLGSDDEAQFGQLIRVRVHAYRGDTTKQEISLWMEKDDEKVSKVLNFKILEKFTAQEITLPVQIFSNCKGSYKDGTYDAVVKGFDEEDSEEVRIKGTAKDTCLPGTAADTLNQKFGFQLLEIPIMIYPRQSFAAKIQIIGDDEQHTVDLWSYVYRGSKSYSGEREANRRTITILPGSITEITLSNNIPEAEPGIYKFKVILNKDDQKTNKEIITNITVGDVPVQEQAQRTMQSSEKSGIQPTSQKPYAVSSIIFESTQRKAEHLVPYFVGGIMTLMTVFLIVSKPL